MVERLRETTLPQFVFFEGIDDSGKTMLSKALVDYYKDLAHEHLVKWECYPGSDSKRLGGYIYKWHHGEISGAPNVKEMDYAAVQLLHVAAHVDLIRKDFTPLLDMGGYIVLDRYWWSTFAYSLGNLTIEQTWAIVNAERVFWRDLPKPIGIYVEREEVLNKKESDPVVSLNMRKLHENYMQIFDIQSNGGIEVHMLENNGTKEEAWINLLTILKLPHVPFRERGIKLQ